MLEAEAIGCPPPAPAAAQTSTPAPPPPATSGSWQKPAGFVIGGLGLLAAAGGVYFGLKASSSWSDFKARCDPAHCPSSERPLYDDTAFCGRPTACTTGAAFA